MAKRPLVAIVGRPNVGKSLLFNRLCGKRLSIVEDTPGVTRDRLYAECEWAGRTFDIVDTGGIEPTADSEILLFMREQAEIAINSADVIVFVTEIGTGVTAADQEVAAMLKRSHKPVVLCVNKMDSVGQVDPGIYEFYSLGLGDPIALSAIHGHGTDEMLDACIENFPPEEEGEEEDDLIRVAVIGKPNVGKSSLVNLVLGENRVIVADMAGTTRDAVDTRLENKYGKYIFIDTAGIRRKSKVDDRIEKFSVMRAQLASGAAGAAGIIRAAGIAGRRIIVRASSVRRCCCRGGASCAGRCVVCRCCIICSTACGCFCCCLSCCFCLAGCLGCFCCLTGLFGFSCCLFGCNLLLDLLDLCVLLCQYCVVLCSHVVQVCDLVFVVIGNGFFLLKHCLKGLLLCFLLCLTSFEICFFICKLIAVVCYLLYKIHVLLQTLSVVFV